MTFIRSERAAAVLLLAAAGLALLLANSPLGPALLSAQAFHVGIPWLGIDLSLGHWVSDGLLAVFFFVAAVELKHELIAGDLNSPSRALRPAIAAAGGVLVPALVYLAVTAGSGYENGWPIPTATDIAFALGVLAVFGRFIPARVRSFLLALAIIDDIVAILIIALFFTTDPDFLPLLGAAVLVGAFALLSRLLGGRFGVAAAILMVIVGIATWVLVLQSGVHATIAGVALGLAMRHEPGLRVRHALEPVTNGVILPVFAFSAALVVIPQVPVTALAPPFWAIALALPLGKILGIGLGALVGTYVGPRAGRPRINVLGFLTIGALGGIGFTVSLLMNELAFAADPEVRDEGTLAVLLGSGVSMVIAAVLVSREARYFRRLRALRLAARAR